MNYSWNELTIDVMTNLYLYGLPGKPEDLVSETLIRDAANITVEVDVDSYMASGPGRFALGSNSTLVERFFEDSTDLSWMEPGVQYTKQMVAAHLGVDSYGISTYQLSLSDGADDYVQRTYVWNSGSFQLSQDVRFVLGEDGTPQIMNYSIVPREPENFDFTGGGTVTQLANDIIRPQIDPSEIGRKVIINFTEETKSTRVYTADDYEADASAYLSYQAQGALRLAAAPLDFLSLTQQLWDLDSINTVYQGKAVIYGSNGGDELTATKFDDAPWYTEFPHRLLLAEQAEKHGVAIVAGNGADSLTGGARDDILYGNDGDDTLAGGGGSDQLFGGAGTDKYKFSSLDAGMDTILDEDGLGQIYIDGQRYASAKRIAENSNTWVSEDGKVRFTLVQESSSSTEKLVISYGLASSIVVDEYVSGQLGLVLGGYTPPENQNEPGQNPIIDGDLDALDMDPDQEGVQEDYDKWGNLIVDPTKFKPDAEDVIYDTDGNDTINTWGGDDYITGGRGGDDEYNAGAGNDEVHSGKGNDLLTGGSGNDLLFGGDGKNKIYGEDASENLAVGGSSDFGDWLDGGAGDDQLFGSNRTDVIIGGGDADYIEGGGGDDLIVGDGSEPGTAVQFVTDNGNGWNISRSITEVAAVEFHYPVDLTGPKVESALQEGADTILAGLGNDWVFGGGGDDYLDGGDGNDVIFGGSGNNRVLGGSGDDHIVGGSSVSGEYTGSNFIDGGDGDDYINGGDGIDRIFGGAGNDNIRGDNTISGAGNDYIDGGNGADILTGAGGDDTIFGGMGNDSIYGDSSNGLGIQGDDTIYGGEGADQILGGGGNDTIYGGSGSNTIFGDMGPVNPLVAGDDFIYGGDDSETIAGDGGSDTIYGGGGDDYILGDSITGMDVGRGNDFIHGGYGNDRIIGGSGQDTIYGDEGSDHIYGDYLYDTGSGETDTLYGGGGDDILEGGGGDDILNGGTGKNQVYGGSGNDIIVSDGSDWLVGGLGNDTYYINASLDGRAVISDDLGENILAGVTVDQVEVILDGGIFVVALGGSRRVALASGSNLDSIFIEDGGLKISLTELIKTQQNGTVRTGYYVDGVGYVFSPASKGDDFSTIYGSGFSDEIEGTDLRDIIYGGGGNNIIHAQDGDDFVVTDGGNDTVHLGKGNDVAYSGAGDDRIFGGSGDDHIESDTDSGESRISMSPDGFGYVYEWVQKIAFHAGKDFIDAGEGDDFVRAGGEDDVIYAGSGNDFVYGDLAEFDNIEYQSGEDEIYGEEGDDTLFGGYGNDKVYGGVGKDTILDFSNNYSGETDDDYYDGGDGDDILYSYFGSDTLVGGAGNDILVAKGDSGVELHGGSGDDTLQSFVGSDRLYGGEGADKFYSNYGFDFLSGGEGNDVYDISNSLERDGSYSSYGYATIQDTMGENVLENSWIVDEYSTAYGGGAAVYNEGGAIFVSFDYKDSTHESETRVKLYSAAELEHLFVRGTDADQLTSLSELVTENGGFINSAVWSDGVGFTSTGSIKNDQNLLGTSVSDRLTGGSGNDIINGRQGDDILVGGRGSDTYIFESGSGQDIVFNHAVLEGESDELHFGSEIFASDLWLSQVGDSLIISHLGSDDSVTVDSWFSSVDNQLDKIVTSDGHELVANQVQGLVNIMASFGSPSGGEINLTQEQRQQLDITISTAWT
ncbi:calcium-binding protein [Pseudomonas viridiflava]|uniref:calcium-binding protein n=1 Tax=Pseudomonas viridiflava TaxID=33069 RepID=UPI000F05AC3C|nr:calcium-binding protein [Pseudomonas viridiflava]